MNVGRREHYDERVEKQLECQSHGNEKCWRVTLFHTFPSFNTEVFKIFASDSVGTAFHGDYFILEEMSCDSAGQAVDVENQFLKSCFSLVCVLVHWLEDIQAELFQSEP